MPVVGVASKLRQPTVGSKPVPTAFLIPNLGRSPTSRASDHRGTDSSVFSCQVSMKSICEQPERRPPQGTGQEQESEDSKIYTDWANHYLAKSGCPRLIKDLAQDIADGVLLAEIIQIIANEKVEDINGCPRSRSQMIENVDACLSFLEARGVNTKGLSAEEIRNGNLKTILGLFFSLSRYKQQQQHQQQYYQSLVELQQHVTHQTTRAAPASPHKTQDMQSSLTARYAAPASHSGIAAPPKKTTRLPGPARVSAAGSGTTSKVHGASNLNRRSQSFNSIDKSKPLQYASGNDRVYGPAPLTSIPYLAGMNGSSPPPPCADGQQPVSGIPWRSKSMNMKHSATSSMLAVTPPSPVTSPTPSPLFSPTSGPNYDRLRPPLAEAPKAVSGGQRSMLERFKLINTRPSTRHPPFPGPGSVTELPLCEEEVLLEYGEEGLMGPGSACSSPRQPLKSTSTGLLKSSGKASAAKMTIQPKEKEDKAKGKSKASTPNKEEKEQSVEPSKKTSKIASLIPKGGKCSAVKKESPAPVSSGIPKPGVKASPSGTKLAPSGAALGAGGREGDAAKPTKGSQRQLGGPTGLGGRRPSMVSSSSTSALSLDSASPAAGNGVVQLPQQQQLNHPNTATVAPFMYRTYSENDCTSVAPADPCLSPSKTDLVYGKTAKQCLEEISGEDPETRRMRTVKNIADLRQNLEETMSSLRGTQIGHSTLETTFDSTVTTEVNGRSIPSLGSRSSPMSWRLGQSASPRLQAGDAPSLPGAYAAPRAVPAGRFAPTDPSRFMYAAPLRRAAAGARGVELPEKGGVEGVTEVGVESEVTGYVSDGDILAKNVRPEESRCLFALGLSLSLSCVCVCALVDLFTSPFLSAPCSSASWDDSSSVSSGLSDTLDNVSTDDLNAPSYRDVTSSPRKTKGTWAGTDGLKTEEEEEEDQGDTTEPMSKRKPSSPSPGQYEDAERLGQRTCLSLSHTGSWRRGMTPPRTKGTPGTLKSPGKTDDAKASEKGKAPPKGSGVQRSPSDAGKSSGDESKKPPSGIVRPPTTGSFGFKKATASPGQLVTASGATLTSGSSTLGKAPKSLTSGRSNGGATTGGRKTSLDESQPQDDGALLGCGSPRAPLQYRSLPRPAKSSSSGAVTRRSGSSSADTAAAGKPAGAKRRDGGKVGSGRSSPVTVNQTDKEKVAVSDSEAPGLSPKSSPTSTGQSGLRQPGSKYPDIASPTFRRLFAAKAGSKASSPGTPDSGKCPSLLGSPHGTLARQISLDSPSSGTGSLGSGGHSGGSSPLYGLGTGDAAGGTGQSPASSPASALSPAPGTRPWAPLSSSSAGSKDTLGYQSMSSLPTSSESIDLVGHHGSAPRAARTGSVKSTLSEGIPLDRNTLPKKGLRYPPSSGQMSQEEGKEWLRSHSTGGLQDTGSQSPLSPPGAASTTGKYHYSNLLSPTNPSQFPLPGTSMSRSNSIPAQDSSFDLRGEAHALGGSATSLEERPRGMSRSASFRDSMEEVHGSSLSLVSSTSSLYSAERTKRTSLCQQQIRKLRRELDASQEKVAKLTSQLSSNAHLVAAFEKSLGNMTCRLQSLTMTAEQKESELAELRETIEALKAQNTDAQTAIQVALNGPDHQHKDLSIRRQHSSDSMSSINSAASHSSVSSTADAEAKKKKKKSWVGVELRSSFKQAFGKKKNAKPPSPHSDTEEQILDSCTPSSPKLQPAAKQGGVSLLRVSPSTADLCECTEAEAEIILQLKNELREKELKLTDIRLEALSSAHHLDQIREAMNRMQNEIELLKAENDRLKSTGSNTPVATPAKTARPPSETSSTSSSSSRQSLGLSLNNLNIADTIMSDILLDDGYEGNLRKEGRSVRIVVTMNNSANRTKDFKSQEYLIGSIGVSGKTKWDVLDGVIRRLFKEYVFRLDPLTSLGLGSDSIVRYRLGDVVRCHGSELPELLPCGYLVGDNNTIIVSLKGVKENSIDGLAFDTLIPKSIIQRYLNLLVEHRRIILSGPSGTGKSFLASKLAQYIVAKSGLEVTESSLACFNVDQQSSKDLRQYLSTLAEQCNSEDSDTEVPTVVILDNLHHVGSLSDIFNGFLNCKYNRCPYVIGTMSQGASCSPNLELHHNFRWVLCANHTEPVKGFLGRYLRRKLIETEIEKNVRSNDLIKIVDWIPKTWQHLNSFLEAHSSSDVTIGPRLFLSCPMDGDSARVWFTDLWNYSLVPYLLEAVREGLQLYGKRAAWEDPSKWVMDTYPWSSASLQHDWQGLLRLRPEDVGYDGFGAKEGASSNPVSQSESEGDPLMTMLMRLQEAANFSSAQGCDGDGEGASCHDDSSMESTL
uniref:Neuron navigator 3 n=1 Tax=Scleropages formosus TaxID=113540 RepID=A0A8C9RB84_SCLFO